MVRYIQQKYFLSTSFIFISNRAKSQVVE